MVSAILGQYQAFDYTKSLTNDIRQTIKKPSQNLLKLCKKVVLVFVQILMIPLSLSIDLLLISPSKLCQLCIKKERDEIPLSISQQQRKIFLPTDGKRLTEEDLNAISLTQGYWNSFRAANNLEFFSQALRGVLDCLAPRFWSSEQIHNQIEEGIREASDPAWTISCLLIFFLNAKDANYPVDQIFPGKPLEPRKKPQSQEERMKIRKEKALHRQQMQKISNLFQKLSREEKAAAFYQTLFRNQNLAQTKDSKNLFFELRKFSINYSQNQVFLEQLFSFIINMDFNCA